MAVVGFGILASCTSGDIPSGEDPAASGGQATAAAGTGQVGPVAGSPGAGATGVAGSPIVVGTAGMPGTAGMSQGTAGSGDTGTAGAQGQSGSPSSAGNGAGGASAGAGGKGMSGGAGMSGSAGAGPQPLPSITGGTTGFATRYWDCCKPACTGGGKVSCGSDGKSTDGGGNQSACAGGNSFMCYGFAPFQDSQNKYVSYAFAASHRGCGSCWELQFTGKAGCSEGSSCPGKATSLVYDTLFVQVINTGDIANDQFDLLIPGGGVGQFNACSNEWGTSALGAVYGGFLTDCKGVVSCTQTKCNTVFANKPDLLAGCNWFLNWYGAGDNPQITFKQVSCPSQLTSKSGMSG